MIALLVACAPSLSEAEWVAARDLSPAPALPADPTNAVADNPAAAALGQSLFFDARLSADGSVSCATCHDPDKGFADGLELAEGLGTAGRHAPTVLGSALNRWFFWDGRADSAWAQALGPLENPVEHGTTRLSVAHAVAADPAQRAAYEALFGPLPDLADSARFPARGRPVSDPTNPDAVAWAEMSADDQEAINLVFANVGKAVAAYERKLVTGESAFDRWVAGDEAAMGPEAVRGLQLFVGVGQCTLCHSGPGLTDREFHNLALPTRDWTPSEPDYGRYDGIVRLQADPFNGAGPYSDDTEAGNDRVAYLALTDEQVGQFKTPSLRDVARTPPYMHGGQFETLTDVVRFYSDPDPEAGEGHREEIVLTLDLSEAEIGDLVAFLEALDGALPAAEWTTPPSR